MGDKVKYLLEADKELWKKFKTKCASQGKSMLEKIIELITDFVKK